jgi:thioredoxin 2
LAVAQKIVVRCPNCGTKNRVDPERAGAAKAKCARCHSPLEIPSSQSAPFLVSDANFQQLVERSPLPVLMEFWSPYCLHCQRLEPVITRLARDAWDRVRVAKLNIDENPATAARYAVRATPTISVLDRGREVDRVEGALNEDQLRYRFWRWLGT